MEILERLYDAVETHLLTAPRDWAGFAADFVTAFGARVTLYRVAFDNGPDTGSDLQIISTSAPGLMREYRRRRLFEQHAVSEARMAPLEPHRRTDEYDDAAFRNMGELSDFLIGAGMYYLMVVPATMPDGSVLGLYVWRDEEERDFSDLEKQRLALLMRHLLAVVSTQDLLPRRNDANIADFGRRYGLTRAEVEILAALLEGRSLRNIATTTGRSYGTVRWHVQNILEKCQVRTQRGLLSQFYRLIRQ